MKNRTILLTSLFALALLASACAPTTTTIQQAPQRSLSVTGTGIANLTPDIAYVNVGVHTEKLTAAEAVADNNAQTEEVIQALTDFGIDPKDIRTSSFSIWPMDKYDPQTGQPTGEKTYVVDNQVGHGAGPGYSRRHARYGHPGRGQHREQRPIRRGRQG